tara:strand:- start:1438 stop:2031 length:594 start_codon:yes stop_codon:yes gene_type:complete
MRSGNLLSCNLSKQRPNGLPEATIQECDIYVKLPHCAKLSRHHWMQANMQEGQMTAKFVVGYDGSDASNRALDFAISRVKLQGGMVMIVHVLEWSPYSFLSASELEERHKRRKEEMERADKALVAPVLEKVRAEGVEATGKIRYGHIAETICKIAAEEGAVQIVIGRNGHTTLGSRIFGSVAGHLAQAAPVPCTIVP